MNSPEWDEELDALIQLGLLLVNQPEEEFPVVEHTYSPRFKRWERRFLADPFGYVKRKGRPLWVRTLRTAAAVLLAACIAFGTLVAVSPTVRAAVKRWFVEWFQTHDAYRFTDTPDGQAAGRWYPAYLPDGYHKVEVLDLDGLIAFTFEDGDGNRIYFDYQPMSDGGAFQVNNEYTDVTSVVIGKSEGVAYQASAERKPNVVIWVDENVGISFRLISFESCETLLHIAESVKIAE